MIASSRRMVEELGITQGLLETEMFAGLIELIEGDAAAAEQSLRSAYDGLRTHGLGIDAARAAALLGRTLLAQGRAAEAEALSHDSEALAGDDLQAAITWRRVREHCPLRGRDGCARRRRDRGPCRQQWRSHSPSPRRTLRPAGIARHVALVAEGPGRDVPGRAAGKPRRLTRVVPCMGVGERD